MENKEEIDIELYHSILPEGSRPISLAISEKDSFFNLSPACQEEAARGFMCQVPEFANTQGAHTFELVMNERVFSELSSGSIFILASAGLQWLAQDIMYDLASSSLNGLV